MSGLEVILPIISMAATAGAGVVSAVANDAKAKQDAENQKQLAYNAEAKATMDRARSSINAAQVDRMIEHQQADYQAATEGQGSDAVLGLLRSDAEAKRSDIAAQGAIDFASGMADAKGYRSNASAINSMRGAQFAGTLLGTAADTASLGYTYYGKKQPSVYK